LGQTDVEDIKFVINFDYPNSSEDYVHRIGRTARANNTGTAYTFFTQNNCKQAVDLINVLREANQQVNPKLVQLGESARFLGKGMSCRKLDYYFYILARNFKRGTLVVEWTTNVGCTTDVGTDMGKTWFVCYNWM
jgi:superfamily II DNA/RNA helicase